VIGAARAIRHIAAYGLAAVVSAWSFAALADGPVVVTQFSGEKPKQVRDRVVSALNKSGVRLAGAKTPPITPNTDSGAIAAHAREHGVAAYVEGKTTKQKEGYTLKLALRSSATGEVMDTFTFEGAKLPELYESIDAGINGPLTQALSTAEAPKKPAKESAEPADAPPKDEDEDEGEEPPEPGADPEPTPMASASADVTADTAGAAGDAGPGSKQRPSVLELRADLGGLSRSFEYNQDVNNNLRDHDIGFAPVAGLRLRWYPAAHFTSGSVSNLGIIGEFERTLTASASTESGQDYSASSQLYDVGVRWRFPIQRHELGVSVVYGRHELKVEAGREPNATAANGLPLNRDYVPDAGYVYARPGLDARFAVERIHFGLGFGYRAIQQTGELNNTQWFPQATVASLDGSLFAGYELTPGLIALGALDFVRYAHDMHSTVADLQLQRDVAGGAIDQTIAVRIGIEWRLQGPASVHREAAGNAGASGTN
jgi:hypothetical protein